MIVAIVGSRYFPRTLPIHAVVAELKDGDSVISGGAVGVDSEVRVACRIHCKPILEIKPNYIRHGKQAPLIRNQAIAEACDRMIAFWDGRSRGTMHAVGCARRLGKPVDIVRP